MIERRTLQVAQENEGYTERKQMGRKAGRPRQIDTETEEDKICVTSVPMSKHATTTPPPLPGMIIDMGGPIIDLKTGGHQFSLLKWVSLPSSSNRGLTIKIFLATINFDPLLLLKLDSCCLFASDAAAAALEGWKSLQLFPPLLGVFSRQEESPQERLLSFL